MSTSQLSRNPERDGPGREAAHARTMALPMMRHIFSAFGELRFHPLQTRLRARLGDELVVDSTAGDDHLGAQSVWCRCTPPRSTT